MIFDDIKNCIGNHENIAIFTHTKSDCDALGSSIALKIALEKMGKSVQIFVQKPISENYYVLGIDKHVNINLNVNFDLAISLDCPDKKRFGIYENKFNKIPYSIAIDHHTIFNFFADINYLDDKCSSTSLILYRIFKELNIEIDKEMALALYAGISTDTGRFSYSFLTKELFNAVGELVEICGDFDEINYVLFRKRTLNQVELYKRAIKDLKTYYDNQIGVIILSLDDFKETDTTVEETYGIIDYLNGIETVKIACLLAEYEKDKYKVSVRSRSLSAKNVAGVFGGGGHILASGCRIFDCKEKALEKILDAAKAEIDGRL